ncbi:hypothetical protein FM037_13845 [Shewanella psychropiezotolerans]|uniref:HPt domain-containing protein n=1 Tax=Shewanella psychropiezotolerans TaxID=2593655 RepID=A0ABX5WYF4_9GAMM|nr:MULTISPECIES: hypothetical protein [Shewanella]MPY23811.1 hypothetical protein [Shewanella sp. YLB-07]QDO84120.1 hypothetical protein FM037_13845 [Shewanella psychropiezotolerans]
MDSGNHFIHHKILAFFNHQHEGKRLYLIDILSEELDSLFSQTQELDASELSQLSSLAHKLKGICRYLLIQNEVFLFDVKSKQELMFSILMLQNEIKVVKCEI